MKGMRHGNVSRDMYHHQMYVMDAEHRSFPITVKSRPPAVRSVPIDDKSLERIANELAKNVGSVIAISSLAILRGNDGKVRTSSSYLTPTSSSCLTPTSSLCPRFEVSARRNRRSS